VSYVPTSGIDARPELAESLLGINERSREDYYKELPPSLAGYRPICYLCGKRVDRFDYERLPQFRSFRFRAQCHGRVEQMEIPDDALRYDSKRTMFEARGFFRGDSPSDISRLSAFKSDDYGDPKFNSERVRAIEEQMQLQSYREMLKSTGALVAPGLITIDNRYTTSGSASPPKKPTKAELLAMLAEIEKTEAKPAMLELDQQRVIDL